MDPLLLQYRPPPCFLATLKISKQIISPTFFTRIVTYQTHRSKRQKCLVQLKEESIEKKGTVVGAVALIIGTSIGSGILALPNKTSPAKPSKLLGLRTWWWGNKVNFTAMAMAIVPSLFVSTTIPDAFSAATDFAGGYCMTVLYGALPPAMAWAMHNEESDDGSDQKAISRAKPALLGVGLFACGLVVEQFLQDLSIFQF